MIDFCHSLAWNIKFNELDSALWQYRLWSFQTRGTKLERFLPKINILKENYWILRTDVVGRCPKVPKFDFWNSDFWKLLRPMLIQFSKFNDFLWVCWFLGKNLSNFIPLVWKLHNRYCHTMHRTVWLNTFFYLCVCFFLYVSIMAIRVVEFSNGGYKIRKIFA